ncbi:MAG: hypothetical protein RMK97_01985 [Sutterellaceae bacterium]|nr:hypothetical protein [Burkholderiaceae bacterium]MDW8429264.1 hypothetical protein [Sutterellaceae bacterium]
MPLIIRHAFVCPIPDDPGQFAAGRVTPSRWNADLVANMDSGRVLGRTSSGTGAVEEITVSSPLTFSSGTLGVQTFSSTQPGVVPASGGGTTNFLRADGTWAAPPGGGGGGAPTDADYVVLSANATLSNERVLVAGSGLTLNDGGAGGNVTLSIGSGAVTNAMLRNSAALSVIGRSSNSSGSPADITASTDGHVLRRSGTTLGFGQVSTAGIADAAVTDAKLRDSAALSVIGRAANTAGAPADIAAGADGQVLRRSGTTLGFGQVSTAGIADAAVTDAKLRSSVALSVIGRAADTAGAPADIAAANDGEVLRRSGTTLGFGTLTSGAFAANTMPVGTISMTSGRLLGRTTTGAGSAEEITVSGPLTFSSGTLGVQTFSSTQAGVVPASGGGTTNFLRADGTWAAPTSGGGGSPGGSDRQVQFNNAGAFEGASNVQIESGGHLRLPAVTGDPDAPSSAGLVPYVRSLATRPHIWVRSSAGDPAQALQRALYHMRHPQIVGPTNGTNAPTALGVTVATSGTLSFQFAAGSSNRWTSTPRKRYVSATTAGSTAGVRAGYVSFYRGSAAGYGGVFFAARVGQSANFDGCQFFAGLCAATAALGGEPSALNNMIGIGYDSTDAASGNWYLMHNDGSGTATRIELTSLARGVDQGFDLFIYNPPNSGNFHVQIIRLSDNTEVYNNVISTDVPVADTGLTWKVEARNGATTNAVSVEHNFIYVEPLS